MTARKKAPAGATAKAGAPKAEKTAGITEYRVVEPIRHDGTRLEPGETLSLPDDNNTRALLAGGAIQAASE